MADPRQNPLEDSSHGSDADPGEYVNNPIHADKRASLSQVTKSSSSDALQPPPKKSSSGSGLEADRREHFNDPIHAGKEALPAQVPQSSSSTTPRFVTKGNKASGIGVQTISGPTRQNLNVRHEGNEMNGNATQFIGTVEHGSLLPQNENLGDMRKEHVLGEKIYSYLTKDNTVRDGSQNIFAPQQQTSDIMHEENIAENYATQNIGNDPHVAQWRKFGFGFSKKSKGQRRHRGY